MKQSFKFKKSYSPKLWFLSIVTEQSLTHALTTNRSSQISKNYPITLLCESSLNQLLSSLIDILPEEYLFMVAINSPFFLLVSNHRLHVIMKPTPLLRQQGMSRGLLGVLNKVRQGIEKIKNKVSYGYQLLYQMAVQ